MGRYRSRLEIIADVLTVVKGGAMKTQIMYGANLSYTLLSRYLTDVMDMRMVQRQDGNLYTLTEKGFEFLQEFKGYRAQREGIEKRLQDIKDEKTRLINMFLNPSTDLEKHPGIKEEERDEKDG
jgi:predicted transcriptional regulator